MTTGGGGSGVPGTDVLVDVLLPGSYDEALEALAFTRFIDSGTEVPVSPVDQLLMSFTRQLVCNPALGAGVGAGVVLLPRCKHRAALLLGIASQLLCRRPPAHHDAPVVLIGFDVDVASQLRALSVQNVRRMGLSAGNPLCAHRLRRSGALEPLVGTQAGAPDRSFVYYNTRVGSPPFSYARPLVILDGTSVQYPDTRQRAIEWALENHAAAVVAVGDLGDDNLTALMSAAGLVPTVLAVDANVAEDLRAALGSGTPSPSLLSTAEFLTQGQPDVHLYRVEDGSADEAMWIAFSVLAAKPEARLPEELHLAVNMLRNGVRLAARVTDYRVACIDNVRVGEAPVLRRLENHRPSLPPAWRSWGTANLGALHVAVRNLWRRLEEDNPKLRQLWRVLDRLEADGAESIVIRCHSRAAADATRRSLGSGERTDGQIKLWDRVSERVTFATFKERFTPRQFDAQIFVAAPPPWLFALLFSIEANSIHIIGYEIEMQNLARQGERWAEDEKGWQRAACRSFGAAEPVPPRTPIPDLAPASLEPVMAAISIPDLSLARVLDRADEVLDSGEETAAQQSTGTGALSRMCVPVHLEGGRTWWCEDEENGKTPVLVVTVDDAYEYRPVSTLHGGDRIVVPAGEGTDSIHARLVAATRSNADVRALDVILSQFRSAARKLLASRTQQEASALLRREGASAHTQLPAWASGSTIAPREPHDVEIVFEAAGRPCPDLGLIYAVAETLRNLHRTLGRFISAIVAGDREDQLVRLRELVGDVAYEIVDEFAVVTVDYVGGPTEAPASLVGRIR